MNPDFSLSDWMKNRGTRKKPTNSTYDWLEIGEQAWRRSRAIVESLWDEHQASLVPNYPATTDNWKRIKRVFKKMEEAGVEVYSPSAGEEGAFGQLKFKVLSPHPDESDTSDNTSIVVKITAGEVSFLFPGDCEDDRWQSIVKYF